jgi:hypothetical protein
MRGLLHRAPILALRNPPLSHKANIESDTEARRRSYEAVFLLENPAPYGIVWLNPVQVKNGQQDGRPKRKVGKADSQVGFGVHFGVHFSTKRGRFRGFPRLWRLLRFPLSDWESAK